MGENFSEHLIGANLQIKEVQHLLGKEGLRHDTLCRARKKLSITTPETELSKFQQQDSTSVKCPTRTVYPENMFSHEWGLEKVLSGKKSSYPTTEFTSM